MSRSRNVPEELGRFNPSRLTLARKRRGLSKTLFAERIAVDRRSVAGYESGEFLPSDQALEKIETVLEFPRGFFFGDDIDEPTPDVASFRAMSKMTAAQRDMALGEGAIALLLSRWIEHRFELPKADLPDLSREPTPEAAAMALRHAWGWGEQSIPNMVHLLESKGVRIFSLSVESREVDAFSMWKESTPFIFLNTLKSSEHGRFDAAHELGHLVLHRHAAPQGREAEREADEFASAFLMPRGSVLAHAPKFAILPTLVQLKRIWTVSVAALTYRLHALGVLSDWHYRTLYVEIGERGYRTTEPESAPRETSQVLPKVLAALRQEGVGKAGIAGELCISESDLDQLMFGLVLTGLRGGKEATKSTTASGDVQLTLVE
jgi:Zn-dependent peptidase ImmA (M78 family)/transcriptional regulator with XRE-family HTH domain